MIMDIQKLNAFLCVAKHQNFTKASEELFISQPALSKKISDFEKELGVKLLERNNRLVTLTPAGKTLFYEAPTILDALDGLTKKVQQIGSHPEKHLHIACSGVEYARFDQILQDFRAEYPDIKLTLGWHNAPVIRQMLFSNLIDLTFQLHMEVEQEPAMDFIPFYRDELAFIVSPSHPFADYPFLTLKDMQDETYIGIKGTDIHLPYNETLSFLTENNFHPKGGFLIADSVETLVLQVGAGIGISHLMAQTKRRFGNLVKYIPMKGATRTLQTDLVWNKSNTNPAIKIFVDFVKQKNLSENFLT